MITKRHLRRMENLKKIAEDTQHPDKFAKYRHAAAIYVGNKLVSVGTNRYRSHPFQAKFGTNSEAIYIHAEIDAIKNALKYVSLVDLERATLYVVRSKNMKFRNSKPCEGCAKAIATFNIPFVYWSGDEDAEDQRS